jgi:hypothetical protein
MVFEYKLFVTFIVHYTLSIMICTTNLSITVGNIHFEVVEQRCLMAFSLSHIPT